MARLNEPAAAAPGPPAETVEAVKRRFLRQNRELAKTNSQQSIRIRTLENEGSRLLAENLTLREQVLQMQNALESQSSRPSFENIDSVKDRLEAKIEEIGTLVAELGKLKKKDREPRRKSQLLATRRTSEQRQWRSGLCLQEVENAMLPTIAEGKYFPRKTMNADELREILDDPDSQSPDIGPPPISRLENEEPIAFNPTPPPEESPEDLAENPEPVPTVNLESRRKRRESGPKLNIRRVSVFESPPDAPEEKPRTVKAGSKRKFSVQEDGEKVQSESDAFTFSRRSTSGTAQDNFEPDDRSQSPGRPILGSKPVNTDPVLSPKKQRASVSDKPDKKPTPVPTAGRGRLSSTRNIPTQLPPLEMPPVLAPTAEIHLDSLPPKTPAVEDVFSPPSTEPSTSRHESKDTPPPSDLNSGDQAGLGGRPSRRARPQVSYKEPSLAAKMRRPGKELVDAVQGNRRTSTDPTPSAPGSVTIKRESLEGGSGWKSLPAVTAVGGRDDEIEVGSPLKEKLGRREDNHGRELSNADDVPKLSAASKTISALMAGSTRKVGPVLDQATTVNAAADLHSKIAEIKAEEVDSQSSSRTKDKEHLAIFDFTESSPNDGTVPSRPRIDLAKASRNARRHSSVPASLANDDRRSALKPKEEQNPPRAHSRTGSSSGSMIKSSSTSSLSRSTSAAKERKPSGVVSSSSKTDLKAAEEEKEASRTATLRAERAASRRKSMMV